MTTKHIILPQIDPVTVRKEIEDFLVQKIADAGASGCVVGLSGGIDSSTVASLASSAFDRHALANRDAPALAVLGLILPSVTNQAEDERDARDVAQRLGIEIELVEIQPLIDAFRKRVPRVLTDRTQLGNLASEVRAVVLSRFAAAHNYLVAGTGNRDEDYCLGYFTKRGDGAVDISPIGGLSKRHVRILAKHLGIPENICTKTPTAGLWHGQTDEAELGFTYEFAELVLAGYDQGLDGDEIAAVLECDILQVKKVRRIHGTNRHKMTMPEVAQISYLD